MSKTYTFTSNGSKPSTSGIACDGRFMVAATGTFAGASLAIELSVDGGTTWFAATDDSGTALAFTSADAKILETGEAKVRGTLSSAATTTDIDMTLTSVGSAPKTL